DAVAGSRALLAVNAAAYTAVDRAEREPAPLHAANVAGAGHVAASCARHGVALIHLSTDYVFGDGATRPWREDDPVAPLSAYAAAARRPRYSVLDCSKIEAAFGLAPPPWRPRLATMFEPAIPGIALS